MKGKGWTFAKDLRVGDELETAEDQSLPIEAIELKQETTMVYNMTVDEFHTYFVSDLGVWVHNTECGVSFKGKGNPGRSGKQSRLKEIANDDKVSTALRGEIKRDINEIKLGKRKNIRGPQGYNLAHRRDYEARKGYGYEYSDLQTIRSHRTQHKHDGSGKRIK